MKVSRVSEMRTLDRRVIEDFGIAAELLMENAGQAVYFALLKESALPASVSWSSAGWATMAGMGSSSRARSTPAVGRSRSLF